MRKLILLALIVGAGAEDEPDRSWPREYEDKDKETAVVLYQPQVVEWKDYRVLKARAAVEVYYVGKEQPEFGAVELTITTATDHESRAVTLKKIDVSETSFPGLNNPSKAKSAVRRLLPKGPLNVELDRILTNLEQGQLRPKETKVRNNPPKIIVTTKEAILVVLGGEPLYERVPGTKLEVVANTESTLFRKGETHYMLYGAGWLEAAAVTGPWTPAGALPDDFQGLPSFWKDIQSKIPGMPLKAEDVPEIHVVWQSTELIVLDGEPDLKEIPKTNLLYVANTESDLFFSNTDGSPRTTRAAACWCPCRAPTRRRSRSSRRTSRARPRSSGGRSRSRSPTTVSRSSSRSRTSASATRSTRAMTYCRSASCTTAATRPSGSWPSHRTVPGRSRTPCPTPSTRSRPTIPSTA
jgi:hypothetical protein